ncbi:amidohydrolase [Caldalkalibacillus thermarum TA2.A1]|uniref:Amidohydrolase n=2 Tax=Caldalkalibacillus TaxID=379065 RepID=F5LA43_CALTT|nr:amidohydrolase [Caldalkalibacillus thermarum]EGL81763.1 amidohydrolase [Caldalkalibacillus thermarum TA2.A1]QZT34138.1 amidohydrolase [Caldalkalibacillus thermarum TA2.A1]
MDALPIDDQKDVSYRSQVPGKAHLCGHDAHTAILLGAAYLLSQNPPARGNIKLIFQPAEEGYGGARVMVEEGVLDNPKVESVVGLHVHPTIETGYVSVCPGVCTACSDQFELTIIGKGGHAAHPHLSTDSVTVAAEVITALQQIISRQRDPLSPAVLTIGKVNGGYAKNVIAPSVKLEGTVRLLDPNSRQWVKERIEQVTKGICQAFGASFQLDYQFGYPSVVNDEALLPILEETTRTILGEDRMIMAKPSMGAEDFSYFAENVPGVFFRLGIRNKEKGIIYPNHHPLFDIDEDALPLGSAMLAQFALNYLETRNNKNTNTQIIQNQ